MKNYRINYIKRTITVTKTFLKRAETIDTQEYSTMMKLMRSLPDFRIDVAVTKSRPNRINPSYEQMIDFVLFFTEDSDAAMDEIHEIIDIATAQGNQGYNFARKWFMEHYGDQYIKTTFDCAE